jgi:hypothetical protein
MKKKIVLLLFVIAFTWVKGQVNLQKGSLQRSIPIYEYGESMSNMGLNLSLSYNSGNGLLVDQFSGPAGTGWSLMGVSSITRIQKGLPDDQLPIEGPYYDTTKIPPGYLYNNDPISLGCPKALNEYPIFNNYGAYYTQHNKTLADRELDEFQLNLGGRMISFVLDKTNLQKAIVIDKSRVKIKVNFAVGGTVTQCRTTIESFEVIDENGILYEFSTIEKTKVYNIGQGFKLTGGTAPNSECSYELFDKSNEIFYYKYVVNTWKITKIKDEKNNREIRFEYTDKTYFYEYVNMISASFIYCHPIQNNPCPEADKKCYIKVRCVPPRSTWPSYDGFVKNLKGTILKNTILKKEISKIILPNNSTIDFNYNTARKDISNTNAMSSIIINNGNVKLYSFELSHEYFIKNEIRQPIGTDDEKWSRLCLKSIKRVGSDGILSEKPYTFDYYVGTNTTEDFVPPAFFHAKDPWGYYNGSYSGTPTNRLLQIQDSDIPHWANSCIYNQGGESYAGNVELLYNCKPNYPKNGLLKSISYPSGGTELYEYEQNYVLPTIYDYHSNKYKAFDERVGPSGQLEYIMGGVSLSKIIQKNIDGVNDKITKYDYTMPDGTSSMWGVETGLFLSKVGYYWEPEVKSFNGLGCDYDYKYPGNTQPTESALPSDEFMGDMFTFKTFALTALHAYLFGKSFTNTDKQGRISMILATVLKYVLSCISSIPPLNTGSTIKYHNQLNNNLLPIQYKRATVSEYSSNGLSTGKTVYDFTSPDDFPLLIPSQPFPFTQKPRGYYWMYGLPKIITTYDNSGFIIKKVENNYGYANEILSGNNTQSCNCESNYFKSKRNGDWDNAGNISQFTNITSTNLKVDFYNLAAGYEKLTSSKETIFSKSNSAIETVNNFTYNPGNKLVSTISTTNNKGYLVEKKLYYPEDYNLINPDNSNLQQLVNSNKVNSLISSETWQKKGINSPELLSASITEFGIAPNGDYKPIKTYGLQTDKPIPQNIIGFFDPNKLVRNPPAPTQSLIIPTTEITYDGLGSPVQVKDIVGNRNTATLYWYNHTLPVANITNAGFNEIAYTSFEKGWGDVYSIPNCGWSLDEKWVYNNTKDDTNVPTGKTCTQLNTGASVSLNPQQCYQIVISKDYKLTLWATSSSVLVNGVAPSITGSTINGWTYYEFDLPAGSASPVITGNCKIDELRLYPKNATMATTTYNVGIGKTSECDINNRIVYYEYDGLGRLNKVLDENRNIIKTYEYHFKN